LVVILVLRFEIGDVLFEVLFLALKLLPQERDFRFEGLLGGVIGRSRSFEPHPDVDSARFESLLELVVGFKGHEELTGLDSDCQELLMAL
jgi:hypothetical protein